MRLSSSNPHFCKWNKSPALFHRALDRVVTVTHFKGILGVWGKCASCVFSRYAVTDKTGMLFCPFVQNSAE